MAYPIMQFGTSRFLQAHADLFVSEALTAGRALGGVTVVQTTGNAESRARIAALREQRGYPVRIRGMRAGEVIDETVECTSIHAALDANADWRDVRNQFAHETQVVISNTGDAGYALDAADSSALLHADAAAPRGFAAKLVVLLHDRFAAGAQPVTLLPCELVTCNGDTLRELVITVAQAWQCDADFIRYVGETCVWLNSLVDRIVSEPIRPVGAIAEPYALWAIERRAGMVLPCEHAAVVVTDDLAHYAELKLLLLNLGHTWLAERWQAGIASGRYPSTMNVLQAMHEPTLRDELEAVWRDEVLPVFDARGKGDIARAYLDDVRERFGNPFLDHRLADIAQHHSEKKQRRFGPVVALARAHCPALEQPRLRAALAAPATI